MSKLTENLTEEIKELTCLELKFMVLFHLVVWNSSEAVNSAGRHNLEGVLWMELEGRARSPGKSLSKGITQIFGP